MTDVVNIGVVANDGTGDNLRSAMQLINQKFVAVQAGLSPDAQDIVQRVEDARDDAENSAIAALASENAAGLAAATAQAASDSAATGADVYASAALGLSGTTIGEQFQVVSADGLTIDRYRHDAGPVATLIASYPASSYVYETSFAPGLSGTLPNLFVRGTADLQSNSDRFVDAGVAQATVTASAAGGLPAWRVQAAAGQTQSLAYRFPVVMFAGYTAYSAGLRLLAADAATGGSGDRLVRVHLTQVNSGGSTIGGATTVTTQLCTAVGSVSEVPFLLQNQTIDAACAWVQLRVEVQNTNGTSARNAYVRDMIVCAGPTAIYRHPAEARATNAEAIAGTDTSKIITPASLAASIASSLVTPTANIAVNAENISSIFTVLLSAKIEPPVGLNWDTERYPLYVYRTSGGAYGLLTNQEYLRGFVSAAIWAATPYYVDATKADNAGDGLTPATAKRDINAAITLANSDVQAGMCIYVASATGTAYFQTRSINGSAGTVEPTKPCALIATGGRVRHWAGTIEASWVNDGSGTNTFTGGPSSAVRVFDRINLTNGIYTELVNVADQATVRTTPGSWTDIGATLAVKRADGLAPTVDNTLVLRNISVAALDSCTTDLYIEGFDFEGGPMGALWCDPVANRNIVLNDCTFRYAGNSTNMLDGLRVRRTNGLVLLNNCSADGNWKDGFNYHTDSSGGQMYVLQNNCTSIDNGRAGSSSNNGVTTHDSVILIDVNGNHQPTNDGAVFHVIEDTLTWCVGTDVVSDAGGDSNQTAFKASNNAEMWLQGTTATGPTSGAYALHAQGIAGKIHKRNHTTVLGSEVADVGAAIDAF